MKNRIVHIIICICMCSCNGPYRYDRDLNGGYYILSPQNFSEMHIGHYEGSNGVGIIPATVFAVGQNSDYIIAKQHPLLNSTGTLNKSVTNYFIIPLTKRKSPTAENNLYGPLSYEQYCKMRIQFNIDTINFSIVFKELE